MIPLKQENPPQHPEQKQTNKKKTDTDKMNSWIQQK